MFCPYSPAPQFTLSIIFSRLYLVCAKTDVKFKVANSFHTALSFVSCIVLVCVGRSQVCIGTNKASIVTPRYAVLGVCAEKNWLISENVARPFLANRYDSRDPELEFL